MLSLCFVIFKSGKKMAKLMEKSIEQKSNIQNKMKTI